MKIKKADKCGHCNRYIPPHIRIISCFVCSRFYHAKCSNLSIYAYQQQQNNTYWTCNTCTLKDLPFSKLDNDNFKQTIAALDSTTIKEQLHILPSFKVQTLLNKIPGQYIKFDDLYHNGNSSRYYDIKQKFK